MPRIYAILLLALGCAEGKDELTCDYGSKEPDVAVIDPDAPVFEDEYWTQEEVSTAFAEAKEKDTDAYRAYTIAHARPDLMECAWCACGCDHSDGHLSAVDCYKDMHGFT